MWKSYVVVEQKINYFFELTIYFDEKVHLSMAYFIDKNSYSNCSYILYIPS